MVEGLAPLRILIVEDHQLVRAAVRQALASAEDLTVVADVATAEDAVTEAALWRPDVVLVDIDLPRMRGTELVRELVARFPDMWVVMLTISRSERDLIGSIRLGARGYLSKDLSPDALVRALRDIRNGVMPLSRADASRVIRRLTEALGTQRHVGGSTLPVLTTRENEVLGLLAEGLTDREIAVNLAISRRTVESHVRNILSKLDVSSRLHASRLYRDATSQPDIRT
jgi:DNA-binding NarL/FixJ family response regulator